MKIDENSAINEELVPDSERLYIFFGGIAGAIGMPPFEFYKASNILDYSKIFIRDLSQSWYHNGLPGIGNSPLAITQYLRSRIQSSGAEDIRFVGNSMGGYAALLFCSLLQCGKVIAFSPQTFLSDALRRQHGDQRWPQQINHLLQQNPFGIYELQPWIQQYYPDLQASIYVSESDALDLIHAQKLDNFPHITLHRFQQGGHVLVRALRDQGRLAEILNG